MSFLVGWHIEFNYLCMILTTSHVVQKENIWIANATVNNSLANIKSVAMCLKFMPISRERSKSQVNHSWHKLYFLQKKCKCPRSSVMHASTFSFMVDVTQWRFHGRHVHDVEEVLKYPLLYVHFRKKVHCEDNIFWMTFQESVTKYNRYRPHYHHFTRRSPGTVSVVYASCVREKAHRTRYGRLVWNRIIEKCIPKLILASWVQKVMPGSFWQ